MSTSNRVTRRCGQASVGLLGAMNMYMATPVQAGPSPDTEPTPPLSKLSVVPDLTEFYARNLELILPVDHTAQASATVLAQAQNAPPASSGVTEQLLAIADEVESRDLGDMRGGFTLPSGLDTSLWSDIATSVGGTVVQQLTVPTTNLATEVTQSVPMSVTSAGSNFSISLPVGTSNSVSVTSLTNSGLTLVTTALGSGGVTGLLQNPANNQVVQQVSTFNLSITGMTQMLEQHVVHHMVSAAPSSANMLRRWEGRG